MVIRKIVVSIAAASVLCGAAAAAEEAGGRHDDVLRLIEALENAGLKVTPSRDDGDEGDREAVAADVEFDEVLEKLEGPQVSVEYRDASVDEVLADVRRMTGVNLLLDPRAKEARGGASITMKLDNVKPISVLGNALKMFRLVAVYGDEALMVTLPFEEEPVTLVYDVHELTEIRDFPFSPKRVFKGLRSELGQEWLIEEEEETIPEPTYSSEELTELLTESTPNGQWDDERYSMMYANGMLVVTQRPDVQIQVANIIMALKTRR